MFTAENLPDSQKAQEVMRRFSAQLRTDAVMRKSVMKLTAPDCKCSDAEGLVVRDCRSKAFLALHCVTLLFLVNRKKS